MKARFDKFGSPIGDGTWHVNYTTHDMSAYPQVKVQIVFSSTTESVYVYYINGDKSVHERFSTHCNGLSAFPVQTYSTEEILYALGLLGRKVIDTRSGDLCYKLDLVSKGYKHLLNHFDYTYDDAMAIAAGDDRESLVGKTVILNSGKIRYIRSIVAEVVTTGDVKYEYYQL